MPRRAELAWLDGTPVVSLEPAVKPRRALPSLVGMRWPFAAWALASVMVLAVLL